MANEERYSDLIEKFQSKDKINLGRSRNMSELNLRILQLENDCKYFERKSEDENESRMKLEKRYAESQVEFEANINNLNKKIDELLKQNANKESELFLQKETIETNFIEKNVIFFLFISLIFFNRKLKKNFKI